jgi:hypothetical protein
MNSGILYKFLIKKGYHQNISFIIQLQLKPLFFRSFKYTWESTEELQISGPLSPKILKFADGSCLMANRYIGTWVYDPKKPLELEWVIVGKDVQPFFRYDNQYGRDWLEVGAKINEDIELCIFETIEPFEVSFSRLPFKPVLIFTDHCDFDSDVLLEKQREFFKEMNLKVTKGFFLKKHSYKGGWNSAFEGNETEFQKWQADGHELCYHSLSQSKLPNNGNNELISTFQHPTPEKVVTWIDHGYQSYNVSKSIDIHNRLERLKHLNGKGIIIFWNYYDVGEAIDNLNQLDYRQLNISRVFNSGIKLKDKLRILYFFNSNEEQVVFYRKLAGFVKIKDLQGIIKSSVKFVFGLMKLTKPLNKRQQIIRAQSVFNSEIYELSAFQTIVVKDWVHAFNQPYNRLKEESGLAIVHSYFSFLGKHHGNTLFQNEKGEISEEVRASFNQLKKDLRNGEIWNPTLKEFNEYVQPIMSYDLNQLREFTNYRCII